MIADWLVFLAVNRATAASTASLRKCIYGEGGQCRIL